VGRGGDSSLQFIIARLIGGLGVGAASVLAPAYISEVTPAAIRGRLSSIQQVMIITGLTGAFVATISWPHRRRFDRRVLGRLPGLALDVLAAGHPGGHLPRGPAGHPRKPALPGRQRPRRRGREGAVPPVRAERRRAQGGGDPRHPWPPTTSPVSPTCSNPTTGKVRPILWAGMILAVFQQLVGINIVFYYGAVLWQSVGFSENDALLINILSGALSIGACFAAMAVIDKIGRKPLLLIGSAGMAVTLGILAWCFSRATMVDGALHLPDQVGLIALCAPPTPMWCSSTSAGAR
jgi:SP family sugar:H+ symporter-like MFS transporter